MIELYAVLGGAVIGAAATYFGGWAHDRRAGKAAEADFRRQSYVDLLSRSIDLASRTRTLLSVAKLRGGLQEGASILLYHRKPLDPIALHDWISLAWQPLFDAWSRVWISGDSEAIRLANTLIDKCADLLSALSSTPPASRRAKLRECVLGPDISRQLPIYEEHLREVAAARRELAEFVRRETKRPTAELFSADLIS